MPPCRFVTFTGQHCAGRAALHPYGGATQPRAGGCGGQCHLTKRRAHGAVTASAASVLIRAGGCPPAALRRQDEPLGGSSAAD
eukprot:5756205-Alexandrium_andersonii.AAC.1